MVVSRFAIQFLQLVFGPLYRVLVLIHAGLESIVWFSVFDKRIKRIVERSRSPFDFIFQPVEDDFDWHQGERDPPDDSLAGGDQV
jgi:hypothetical protein